MLILAIRRGDDIGVAPRVEDRIGGVKETEHTILSGVADCQEVKLGVGRNAEGILDVELLLGR